MPRGGARPGSGRHRKNGNGFEHTEFTPEQLQILLRSPHVAYVSRKSVSYTLAFKEHLWQRYCDGVPPVQIFADAGLSIEILGRSRINGLVKTLRKQKEKGLPFNEGSEPHLDQPEKQFSFPKPPRLPVSTQPIDPAEAAKLVHQVAYLSQEMEFLKKIILAGKDGKSK